jgi:prepilin-type N-terminal cleavage/methylation domain-containing protein
MPIQSRYQAGFTLIELITVISLIAIASVWAAPSMASLIRSNRASGEINQIGAAIRYSKSEAIKQALLHKSA